MRETTNRTRRLTLMAMIAAMAYVVMLIVRIPIFPAASFLKYDAKDVVIAIGGFMLGPVPAALISLLVSLLEMITVSESGFIGMFMNVLSTCAFVVPAAWLYHRKRSLKNAVLGLVTGVLLMTLFMLAWNYIITPLYMGYPREAVAAMLLPIFLPFNLLKGSLNAAFTMLLYKPLSFALQRGKLAPPESGAARAPRKFNPSATIVSALVVVTCVLLFYFLSH